MTPDAELLLNYARQGDEAAFAEVVRRHVDLVYSAALRVVGGDAHLAQDVTQSVFTDLARKAATLASHPSLGGWLHTATRYAASKIAGRERRRRQHEQEIYAMNDNAAKPEIDWAQLGPLLDEAVGSLGRPDRDAVVMRYFEGKSHAEVAAAFGLNAEAARKRVDRALEKLRSYFTRRGVTVSSAALATTITAHSVQAAPVGLAANVVGVSLATVGSGVVAASLWKTFLATTRAKIMLTAGVFSVVATALTLFQQRQISQLKANLTAAASHLATPVPTIVVVPQTLAELDQAILLDPRNKDFYMARGLLRDLAGDHNGAIADYTKALELSPNDVFAYRQRADVKQGLDDFTGAIADYDSMILQRPNAAIYPRLFRQLTLRRLGQSPGDFALTVASWNGWNKTLGQFVLGDISEADLFVAADVGDETVLQKQHCDANYFAGMRHLLDNDPLAARNFFARSIQAGESAPDFGTKEIYLLAKSELTRVAAAPKQGVSSLLDALGTANTAPPTQ